MASTLQTWALPRLTQLLPLDEESLKQIITYTDTLPRTQAAEHLKDILGDSAQALEFISSFNQRRQRPPEEARPAATPSTSDVPKGRPKQAKKKANIHALPARQINDHGAIDGAYRKHDEQDYMPKQARQKQVAANLALTPDATQLPLITGDASLTTKPITSKLPPSASGQLVGDALAPKKSAASSRTASPAPKTKVNISGGTAMHGASTALSDLDSAIRTLEIQTNPSLAVGDSSDDLKRQCNCMATRHPLLDIAPNCMNCGKVICVKQGLGPCTFCHKPLLSPEEITKVLRVLKEERGEERMRVNNASHKKADVAVGKARAFTGREFLAQASTTRSSPLSSDVEDDEAGSKAKAHRDKLLNFQANNTRRTQVHDEAADYDLPSAGTNMWASPQERAQQLKKQQRIMREMEWNAKPEYEKRQVVASIDIKSGKVVKRMANIEKPSFAAEEPVEDDYVPPAPETAGAFSNNPLMGAMIRPTVRTAKGKETQREKPSTWRRVQMDEDDNEKWILDGGLYGSRIDGRVLNTEEPACG
ncbi:hypothetical protein AMS68_000071 [Peltaster fructicola]|uniref:TRIP4/RQT4 C2HC5-type zinc finger domain-containing protein n=1 Tax=Peltaster fructicola TaxID=286661 RepID=A0A6H0XIL6_9PEZI|nr:hypothetical protein AMS68_000071 [Peltaster fructicola]